MPQITGCDSLLLNYTDFTKEVLHSSSNVNGARSIEVGLTAALGTNRLLIFSGIANVGIAGPECWNRCSDHLCDRLRLYRASFQDSEWGASICSRDSHCSSYRWGRRPNHAREDRLSGERTG